MPFKNNSLEDFSRKCNKTIQIQWTEHWTMELDGLCACAGQLSGYKIYEQWTVACACADNNRDKNIN